MVVKDIDEKVLSILKIFKRPDFETKLLTMGGTKVKLPAETRWCSHRDSCRSFLKNLTKMRTIMASNPILSQKLTREQKIHLAGNVFVNRVREIVACMDPVCQIVNISQKFKTSIAESCDLWLNFEEQVSTLPLNSNNREFVEQQFNKRRDMALNIQALTANYLDPRYRATWNQVEKLPEEHNAENENEKSHTEEEPNGEGGEKANENEPVEVPIKLKIRRKYLSLITDFLLNNLDKNGLNSLRKYRQNVGKFSALNEKCASDSYYLQTGF